MTERIPDTKPGDGGGDEERFPIVPLVSENGTKYGLAGEGSEDSKVWVSERNLRKLTWELVRGREVDGTPHFYLMGRRPDGAFIETASLAPMKVILAESGVVQESDSPKG